MKKDCIGPNNNSWKGGKKVNSNGYVLIWMPDHPCVMSDGYIYEHRIIMEKHLNRYLNPGEEIHHINGNRQNNKQKNLRLFKNKSEHISFEIKQRRSIAQIMKEVLVECKTDAVMYGDVRLLDECASRATHTTLMEKRPPKRHNRIFKALDNSGLFVKSKVRITLLDGRENFPVRYFTLIQEWPQEEK